MKQLLSPSINIKLLIAVLFIAIQSTAQPKIIIGENGKSYYYIYINSSAPKSVKAAADDLKLYINKASGLSLKIVSGDRTPSGNYISIGSTTALKASGINTTGIYSDGFRITTKDKNLFIFGNDTPDGNVNSLGGRSNGTANGVYTFLENYLGIKWLMPGEAGEYIPKTEIVAIPAINILESSPFLYRHEPHIGNGELPEEWAGRMKLGKVSFPQYNHAWEKTIPASLYDEHPTWFAQINGKHLPPGERYKLETTNPELVQAYANVIIKEFRKDTSLKWYSLSPSDGINGEVGWSNSKEALALIEKRVNGKNSRTSLILKFYNDVAKIVRKEFPDNKLGGYIYADYFYPPSSGIPKMEPNLAFMIATHVSYGYQLYRKATQVEWESVVSAWAKSAKENGFDIYYYDLPTAIMQHNGIVMPPAPEILNFIYPRLLKYGFKGAYIYGRPVWPVFGPSNYTIAKMKWNPKLDANKVLSEYYQKAYGNAAAVHVEKLYNKLDSGYKVFYNNHPEANYNLAPALLKEIYGVIYPQLEIEMTRALNAKSTDESQAKRLEQLGKVFYVMHWNLSSLGLLSKNFTASFAKNDAELDELLTNNKGGLGIITDESNTIISQRVKVEGITDNPGKRKLTNFPTNGSAQLLLYAPADGKVTVTYNKFNSLGEFVRYSLLESDGKFIKSGALREGRKIEFVAKKGKSYLVDMVNRRTAMDLSVEGAYIAYKTNRDKSKGFRIPLEMVKGDNLPMYFYVPAGTGNFGVNMSFASGVIAKIYSPDGQEAGELNTVQTPSSRFTSKQTNATGGFWKIVINKPTDAKNKTVALMLDEDLPQWFMPEDEGLIRVGK